MRIEIFFSIFILVAEAAVIKKDTELTLTDNKQTNTENSVNKTKNEDKSKQLPLELVETKFIRTDKKMNDKNVNNETINKKTHDKNITISDTDKIPTNKDVSKIENEVDSISEILEDPSIFPIEDCVEDCIDDFNDFIFREDFQSKYKDDYFDDASDFFLDVSRFKRSANIIEEENRATTIPKHQISGTDTKSIDSRFFKNIHA